MLYARVAFAGMVLAEVGVAGCYSIDKQLSDATRDVEVCSPIGALYKDHVDVGGVERVMVITARYQFKNAVRAEHFEIAHQAKLAKLQGGGLRYDNKYYTYLFSDAQMPSTPVFRRGVNCQVEYSFLIGDFKYQWRLGVLVDGQMRTLTMDVGGKKVYPATEKIYV